MNRTAHAVAVPFLLPGLVALPAQDLERPAVPRLGPDTPTVEEVVAALEAREAGVQAVFKQVRSRTVLPQGMEFRSTGKHRVLVGTHLHVEVVATFGEDEALTARHELVRTPEGIWVRERDPVQGTLATFMEPELMRRVDAAVQKSGANGPNLGTDRQLTAPLGSALVRQLGEQFALRVEGRIRKDGRAYWKIVGSPVGEAAATPADGIEILIDELDVALREVRHFRNGRPVHELVVESLRLDRPEDTDPATYRIELAEGEEWLPIMEHPPSAATLREVLEGGGGGEDGKEEGKDGGEAAPGRDGRGR